MRQLPINPDKISSKLNLLIYFLFLVPLLNTYTAKAQQLAFPTAEGYGRFVSGGRGGKVIYVTNLNDSGNGSLRAALTASGPRTVVFSVSGTITLQSPISIRNGDLTIAGQTSPNGITLRRHPVYITADNVIIRYLRFRLGGEAGKSGYDALSIRGISRNVSGVMVDHCSISWARDECFSIVGTPYDANKPPYYGVTNVTLQWSFITEGLKGHAFGGFIKYQATKISVLKNLFANNTQRNPNVNGATGSITNNVIYNWAGRGLTVDNVAKLNIIGNYAKVGPNVKKVDQGYMVIGGQGGTPIDNQLYVDGNYHSRRRTNPNDNNEWGIFDPNDSESKYRKSNPHNYNEGIKVLSAFDTYDKVLANGGASKFRDAVDDRIVRQVKDGTGQNDIASPASVGGWPNIAMGNAYPDQDKDGMDDNWERAVGLNPDNASDGNEDRNGDGYTNLEEFLNCVVLGDCESSAPVNTAPTISNVANQTIDENTVAGPLNFTIGDAQTEANALTVTAASDNQTLVANEDVVLGGNGTQRTVTITPKTGKTGSAKITLTVSDGDKKTSTTFTLTVNEVAKPNTPPTISAIEDQSIDENTSTVLLEFTVGDEESDTDDLVVTASSANQNLVANNGIVLGGTDGSRTIKVTPKNNQTGSAKITLTVSDGDKQTATSFILTVNDVTEPNTPPTISAIEDQSIDENTSTGLLEFTVGDEESDTDDLIVTASSANQNLVANNGIVLGGTDGSRTIKVTPKNDQTGSAKITMTVSDGDKKTSISFILTVNDVTEPNTPPTISAMEDQSIDENTSTGLLNFTVGDEESDTDDLVVTASSANQNLVANNGIVLGGTDGSRTIKVTPKNDQTGSAKITMTVSDGDKKTSTSFILTVNKVVKPNTPPTVSEIKSLSIEENTSTQKLPFVIGDTETDPDDLIVSATSSNQSLVKNTDIALDGSGGQRNIKISPQTDKTGITTITVKVSDGTTQVTESFTVTVNTAIDVNSPPTISEIKNQSIWINRLPRPIYFEVRDEETSSKDLKVTVRSDNQSIVPNNRIFLRGKNVSRLMYIYPRGENSGSCNITVEVSDDTDITTMSFQVDVSIKSNIPGWLQSKLTIYPNPFNNYIKVDTKEIKRGVELAVYDLRGRLRKRARMSKNRSKKSTLQMDLSSLESGTYYLRINYDRVKATTMIVKRSY